MTTKKRLLRSLAEHTLSRLPRRTAPGDRLILAYHNIRASSAPLIGDVSLHLEEEQFDRQLRVVAQEADIVPLTTILESAPRSDRERNRLVAVTFDDAYASAVSRGLPICTSHGVAATVFVAPGLLGTVPVWDDFSIQGIWTDVKREEFLWHFKGQSIAVRALGVAAQEPVELRIATLDQLTLALHGTAHTLGNHTMDHVNLGAVDLETSRMQVQRAQEWLSLHFPDRMLEIVAYPYGIPPSEPISTMQGTTITLGLKVSGGRFGAHGVTDAFAVPRWNVPSGITEDGFRLRLRGWLT